MTETRTAKRVDTFGYHKLYLLGIENDGNRVWLQEPEWESGWYWGVGYVQTFTDPVNPHLARDLKSHGHWKSSGVVGTAENVGMVYTINQSPMFAKTTTDDNEAWFLSELMKTIFTLREVSDLMHRGGSGVAYNPVVAELVRNPGWGTHINQVILPALFEQVSKLLSPKVSEVIEA